jgi:hypothetical protein
MYVFIPTCALFLAYEVLPNIPMESDSVPTSNELSKIDRENSILAIQTHQEIHKAGDGIDSGYSMS